MFFVSVCSWLTFHLYINSDAVVLDKLGSCILAMVFVSESVAEIEHSYIIPK